MATVSIIIPVLHSARPLNKKRFFMPRQTVFELLAEIQENVKCDYELIVVCNGQDGALTELVVNDKRIRRYCLNSENVGVARAWNMGAQLAEGEYLCFLNDDVSVGKAAVERMVAMLESDPNVGQVGPAGSFWSECAHSSFATGKGVQQVDVISGFCFMLKAQMLHDLGGFDVNFTPAGYEEIDLSYRIREAGLCCQIDSEIAVKHFHHHGVSAQKTTIDYLGHSIDTEALHERNRAYFVKKWGGK